MRAKSWARLAPSSSTCRCATSWFLVAAAYSVSSPRRRGLSSATKTSADVVLAGGVVGCVDQVAAEGVGDRALLLEVLGGEGRPGEPLHDAGGDRKSTRLNSSHVKI